MNDMYAGMLLPLISARDFFLIICRELELFFHKGRHDENIKLPRGFSRLRLVFNKQPVEVGGYLKFQLVSFQINIKQQTNRVFSGLLIRLLQWQLFSCDRTKLKKLITEVNTIKRRHKLMSDSLSLSHVMDRYSMYQSFLDHSYVFNLYLDSSYLSELAAQSHLQVDH